MLHLISHLALRRDVFSRSYLSDYPLMLMCLEFSIFIVENST
jgi:hypothetical protein